MAASLKEETVAIPGINSPADLGRLWLQIFGAEDDAERLREMADLDAYEKDTGALAGLPEWEERLQFDSIDAWRRVCGGADVELAKRIPVTRLAKYIDLDALGQYILGLRGGVWLTEDGLAVFRLYHFRHKAEWVVKIRISAEQAGRKRR